MSGDIESTDRTDLRCRACLVQRRSLRSIFQMSGSHTYADMLAIITNVKIRPNDGGPNKICLTCRSKTEELYSFKILVEHSNRQLFFKNEASDTIKKIVFDNVSDIKCEIDYVSLGYCVVNGVEDSMQHVKFEFNKDEEEIFYKNTVIKKLYKTEYMDNAHNDGDQYRQSDTEYNFVNNIKRELSYSLHEEADENDYYDDWRQDDFEYLPPGTTKSTKMLTEKTFKNKKKHMRKCKNTSEQQVNEDQKKNEVKKLSKKERIKPVYLKDFYVMKAKTEPHKQILKPRPTYVQPKRVCPYCGKVMKNLHTHLPLHTGDRKYKCSECPKAFLKIKDLQKHVVTHTGVKNFKCNTCGAAFYDRDALTRHLLCHKAVKDEVCSICSKAFRRRVTLRRHMIRHSSANKTVKCELCNMTFYEKCNLQHHMRIHTGERPYKCELCSQPYSYKRDFDRHCLKKHGVYVQKRGIRIMNEELLQKERQDVKAALESQQQADAVQSILSSTSSLQTDSLTKFKYPHLVNASQLKTLFNL